MCVYVCVCVCICGCVCVCMYVCVCIREKVCAVEYIRLLDVASSLRKSMYACTCVYTCVHKQMCPMYDMGWLRLVGSLQLLVSFGEHRLF